MYIYIYEGSQIEYSIVDVMYFRHGDISIYVLDFYRNNYYDNKKLIFSPILSVPDARKIGGTDIEEEFTSQRKLLQKYNIEIISWECEKPIKNMFK